MYSSFFAILSDGKKISWAGIRGIRSQYRKRKTADFLADLIAGLHLAAIQLTLSITEDGAFFLRDDMQIKPTAVC